MGVKIAGNGDFADDNERPQGSTADSQQRQQQQAASATAASSRATAQQETSSSKVCGLSASWAPRIVSVIVLFCLHLRRAAVHQLLLTLQQTYFHLFAHS